MTFRDAVHSLDTKGENGAKRFMMTGYVYRDTVLPEGEDVQKVQKVHLVGRDGSETVMTVAPDGKGIEHIEPTVEMSVELLNALVFATDWSIAPKAELERARKGEGGM